MLSAELGAARSSHRKSENTWCGERAVLVRKLQFLEKYGTLFRRVFYTTLLKVLIFRYGTLEGTHSEHRAQERRAGGGGGGGGKQNQMKMERLEDEARERQKELDKTRQQLLRVSG